LTNLLTLFANNILPIFLAAGAGYLISRYLQIDPRSVSRIAFYIFSPCLIFTILTTSQLNGSEVLITVGFTLASVLIIGLLAWVIGKSIHLERRLLVAVVLTAMFSNSGNYGLSLNLFAFGESALAYASLYFVTSAILMYTVGVFIASLGESSIIGSIKGLAKVPVVYAVLLALIFNYFSWKLPLPLDRTVSLLGNAAIPLLMVLIGIQLRHAKWDGQTLALSISNSLRLVAGPILALGLSVLFGLSGSGRQAGVTEAAMPTAILMTVLATEYRVEPSFVTMTVVTSTLLSPLTVTLVIAYLGA
jgi:predicted permease